MGKVFSWEEIVTGKIPKLENFSVVQEQIFLELEKCNEVIGGVVCGSVLRGDHNVRSDLDCLLVHDGKNVFRVIELLQDLDSFAKELFIPVEFILVDKRVAHTPTIERSFGMHLDWSARNGGCIKKNPVSMISFHLNLKQELQNYVRLKFSKLTKQWIKYPKSSSEQRFHLLQKILEAPVYIARKIIRWQGVDISFDDSKKIIVELYLKHFNNSKSSEFFKEVVDSDLLYSRKLLQQLECPKEESYHKTLREIEVIVPNVLEFIRLVMLMVNDTNNK